MRLLGLVPVAAGAAFLAGSAAADPIPIPPVTVPTVTVPTVTVPLPAPTPPPPTAPVPLPAVPTLPQPVVTATAPVQTTAGSATSTLPQVGASAAGTASSGSAAAGSPAGAAGASGGSSTSSPSAASGPRADQFHSSRTWIGTTGSKRRRTTTLTFVLQQPGRVIFTVNQVSPACVGLGHFSAAGHAGLNRIRFAGVVHGRQLGPGTYRISIRTAAGRTVRRITLVVVDGPAPSRDELQALRVSNTCHGGGTTGSNSTTSSGAIAGAASATPLGPQQLPKPKTAAAGLAPPPGPNLHSGVLGSSVEKTARALEPLLIALLALSIVLLGLAALPREAVPGPRMHDTLARHRLELATVGGAALVAVALAFLLT